MKVHTLLSLSICVLSPTVLWAQDEPAKTAASLAPVVPTGDSKPDLALWADFLRQTDGQSKSSKEATERYLEFLRTGAKSSPALNSNIAINAWDMTIDLVDRRVKDPEEALVLCDEVSNLYKGQPNAARLLATRARVLIYEGRSAEAQNYIEANWAQIAGAPASTASRVAWFYCLSLQTQGKRAEIAVALEKILMQSPLLLDEDYQSPGGWMYRILIKGLLAQGKTEEALSWARLRWMEGPFDEKEIQEAASMLAQVWNASEVEKDKMPSQSLAQFIASQQNDPVQPDRTMPNRTMPTVNPLALVALPSLDASELQAQLTHLTNPTGDLPLAQNTHQRINLFILAGQWGAAMSEARLLWTNPATTNLGLKEIVRVFKAHDLSLTRANAFLDWSETRQGMDPLNKFMVENPVPIGDTAAGANAEPDVSKTPPVQFAAAEVHGVSTDARVVLPTDAATWQGGEVKLNDELFDLSRPEVLKASPFEEMLRRDLLTAMFDIGSGGISLRDALQDHGKSTERWVGYAYAAAGDQRAVAVLEDVLSHTAKPVTTKAKSVDLTYLLICLSSYYEKKGDLTKAAETQLRVLDYIQADQMPKDPAGAKIPVAGMIANQLISAARLYQQAGDKEKAGQNYALAANYGYGWASGMALYDQALQLVDEGKQDEARQMLQQPVEGLYSDQVQIGMLTLLGRSYYATREFDAARKYSQDAVNRFAALKHPLQGENLDVLVGGSRQELEWLDVWKKGPLVCKPGEVHLTLQALKAAPQSLTIHSLEDVPLTIRCDDARLQIGQLSPGKARRYSFERTIDVAAMLSPMAPTRPFETTLTIQSPNFQGFVLRVPVHVAIGDSVPPQ